MSIKPHAHLGVVPAEQRVITQDEFPEIARANWTEAKDAYADAFRHVATLHDLLHRPGMVQVRGRTTGAAYEAKQARDAIDRVVVALDAILTAAKETR